MPGIEMASNDGSVVAKEQENEPYPGKADRAVLYRLQTDPCCVTVTQL